jgi:hypothetical protein
MPAKHIQKGKVNPHLAPHSFANKPEYRNNKGRPSGSIVYVKDLAKIAAEELAKPGKTKETIAQEVIHMLIHKKILDKEDMAAMKVLIDLLSHLNTNVQEANVMKIEWGGKSGNDSQD